MDWLEAVNTTSANRAWLTSCADAVIKGISAKISKISMFDGARELTIFKPVGTDITHYASTNRNRYWISDVLLIDTNMVVKRRKHC